MSLKVLKSDPNYLIKEVRKYCRITSLEGHKTSCSLDRQPSLECSRAVWEPAQSWALFCSSPSPRVASRTGSHFSNAENALQTNSCSGVVGVWLILATDMSAKHKIKSMQQAHRGSHPFSCPQHNMSTEVQNKETLESKKETQSIFTPGESFLFASKPLCDGWEHFLVRGLGTSA